jgi:hypothetical protein
MAGFADLVSSLLAAVADPLSSTLQAKVLHYEWLAQSGSGAPTWKAPGGTSRQALVIAKQQLVKTSDGKEVMSSHYVFFPRPVIVSPKDRFQLPGEVVTRPVLSAQGLENPVTGTAYYREVFLG